jgi:hypothetical protein
VSAESGQIIIVYQMLYTIKQVWNEDEQNVGGPTNNPLLAEPLLEIGDNNRKMHLWRLGGHHARPTFNLKVLITS